MGDLQMQFTNEKGGEQMVYLNLVAELARKQIQKKDLVKMLRERGIKICYATLLRQLKGESDIPITEALVISEILHTDIVTLFERSE
jgi:hypothetical protein